MKIITYPIKMDEAYHKALKEAARESRLSIQQFILKCIEEKINKGMN